MTDLAVEVVGEGETVVLVHGSGVRDWTWVDQRELADRYRLVLPFRRGYGSSPRADPDFERDAADRRAAVFEDKEQTPEQFGAAFAEAMGFEPRPPSPELRSVLESFMRERSPHDAEIPKLDGIPVLIVSGGWHPAFETVCDSLEERLGAERAVLPGSGHGAQHAPGFNQRVVAFWESLA